MHASEPLKITITDLTEEGEGIGKTDDRVFFVQGAVPGDVCEIEITGKKKNIIKASCIRCIEPSAGRVTPPCSHFKYCGGCTLQHLDYAAQLAWKNRRVLEVMKRIGKIVPEKFAEIAPSPQMYYYRNKMDFSFSSVRWLTPEEIRSGQEMERKYALGFHRPQCFDKVLDIHQCWLQADPSNAIRNFIRNYFIQQNISFFDIRKKGGGPRSLIIRSNRKGNFYLLVSFFEFDENRVKDLCNALMHQFPAVKGIWIYHNTKGNDTLFDLTPVYHTGEDYIEEEICGLTYRYGPLSFFQVNVEVAEQIFYEAMEKSEINKDQVVWDLYCGVGTLTLPLSLRCKKAIGIEILEQAIAFAKENARINQIHNAEFYAGDVKKVLYEKNFLSKSRPDVVFCDPPRAGMDKKILELLLEVLPEKMVYVSCNPATQARDVEILSSKYRLTYMRPFDMFPQTTHIENLCILQRI
ncbi:MAG: 23S rRNA (uracil(1939)-C(5))-methyltransferase RlmD [Bacteroidia bacterium]|nr:23S rRNA (uracil(1939)-C(5))-methyltransferase RlmD [Bacteroidia bacterium]